MALINVSVDDDGLPQKFSAAIKLIPDHNREGTSRVAELGRDKARELAPFEIGYLDAALTFDPAHGSIYAQAKVYIGDGPVSHGKPPAAYGAFQEEGYHHEGSGEYIRNPFMEPATGYLNAGVAELTLDQEMYLALSEAGLDPGIGGLVGAP